MDHDKLHIYIATLLRYIGRFHQLANTGDGSAMGEKAATDLAAILAGRHLDKGSLARFESEIDAAAKLSSGLDRDSQLNDKEAKDVGGEQCAARLVPITSAIRRANQRHRPYETTGHQIVTPPQPHPTHHPASQHAYTHAAPIQGDQHHIQPSQQASPSLHHLPSPTADTVTYAATHTLDYASLWRGFIDGCQAIQECTDEEFPEALLGLLSEYASNIPSSTSGITDVSLYDCLKSTAAIAVCLHDLNASGERPQEEFLLIGADLCGIQPYIYKIISKYAGKSLRGRSFYLQLLTNATVRHILTKLGLFKANVIYDSGGGFYILAPNTSHVQTALMDAAEDIERAMFSTHGSFLFMAIANIGLPKDVLSRTGGKSLGDIWDTLFSKKDAKKNAKYKDLIVKDYAAFFTPHSGNAHNQVDAVTGEDFRKGEAIASEGDVSPIRPGTKIQIMIGRALMDADAIVSTNAELPFLNDKVHIQPLSLGAWYYFVNARDLEKIRLHHATFQLFKKLHRDYAAGLTFEQLCDSGDAGDFHRLGVLRMDVDNLGEIFRAGFAPEQSTLPRMSALSRAFDCFFSDHVATIMNEVDARHLLSIYSGGDDLFIVGRWDTTLRLAEQVHDEFRAFACGNPMFSISGGVAIVDEKFPIMKGAMMAAEEEENAKRHCCGGWEKNAISFMGMALNFDEEYPKVKALKDKIVTLCNGGLLPTSFLSKTILHWRQADFLGHHITNPKVYWMMAYDFCRMSERLDRAAASLVGHCKAEVCQPNGSIGGEQITTTYHPLELWAFACRWAELELRGQNH